MERHDREVKDLHAHYRQKLEEMENQMKTMKGNMEIMEDNMDELNKEKEKEKQLRLKLEEEYMQNTKNHEEEVKLRLKFEGKFNEMMSEHRVLTIRYNRIEAELAASTKELVELGAEHKDHLNQLKDYKKRCTEQDTTIAFLSEYKENAEKELYKKNGLLIGA